MKYIIANLKEHQNLDEAQSWIESFKTELQNNHAITDAVSGSRLRIIIAPSHPFIVLFHQHLSRYPGISLAAQDVSLYDHGSYTGETGAHTLVGIVQYTIIGHSERRTFFSETNETVRRKIQNSIGGGFDPIVCVRDLQDVVELERGMVAYEPMDAIGSGHNYPIESVQEYRSKIQLRPGMPFLYGGSVDENNHMLYLKSPVIDGLLIGTACRDANRFSQILSTI